jgi:hopanoid biosynthesis associated protein HpnK
MKTLVTVADDFGLSPLVNEAVEQAAQHGILTSASLMVGAPAAEDAVRRAKKLRGKLRVGLHLVVVEGRAMLPRRSIPRLVNDAREFPSDQVAMGFRYAFNRDARAQLAREIRAQFAVFRSCGLALDHANAHKHMQLHPVVGQIMLDIGKEYGLRAVRVPAERPVHGFAGNFGNHALYGWSRLFRWQAHRAGMLTNDRVMGLGASGHMVPALVQRLVDTLPDGLTELYFHPATGQDDMLRRHMPTYEHTAELQALLTTQVPADVRLSAYSDLS